MDNIIPILAALVAGLLGYGLFQKSRRNSAEAGLSNLDTKEEALKLESSKLTDDEIKARDEMEARLKEKLNEILTSEDLTNFFNGKKKD